MTTTILRLFLSAFTLVLILTGCAEVEEEQARIWGERMPSPFAPPPEFDHPYTVGKLTITRFGSTEDIKKACPKATRGMTAPVACSRRWRDLSQCEIYMVADYIMVYYGYRPDDVLRHEHGHCNGWDHDQ